MMMLTAALLLLDGGLPTSIQDETAPPPERPDTLEAVEGSGRPILDLDWAEVGFRAGLAVYSEDFDADPAPSVALHARAPMPWLSPASRPNAELFGAFVQLGAAPIERDVRVENPEGTAFFLSAGVDFTFVRDGTWLLMAQVGPQYVSYGDVGGLDDGLGLSAGVRGGLELGRGISISGGPEVAFGRAGDRVVFAHVGLLIDF